MVRGRRNPLHVGLPARLRKARRVLGLTPKAVVQRIGGDQLVVREIEEGRRLPTVGTIARLAAALNVTPAWLAYGIGGQRGEGPAGTCEGMGARVQSVRLARDLTKAALARLVDLSPSAYAKIENGGQSGVEVIEALAHALEVSPAWLAFNEGPQVLPSRRRGRPPSQPSASVG